MSSQPDPDRWRSRKTAGELRDIAHPERNIREFKAKVLLERELEKEGKVPVPRYRNVVYMLNGQSWPYHEIQQADLVIQENPDGSLQVVKDRYLSPRKYQLVEESD